MTAAAILLTFLASIILYRFTPWDGYLFGASFYVLTTVAGLLAASVFAVLSRNRQSLIGIGVLWVHFLLTRLAWSVGDEHYVLAQLVNFSTAAYFVLIGSTRWEWTIGGIFLVSVGAGALGMFNMLPADIGGYLSLTFPMIAGLCSDLAAAVLGLGAGDSGKRVRVVLRVRPRLARAAA